MFPLLSVRRRGGRHRKRHSRKGQFRYGLHMCTLLYSQKGQFRYLLYSCISMYSLKGKSVIYCAKAYIGDSFTGGAFNPWVPAAEAVEEVSKRPG